MGLPITKCSLQTINTSNLEERLFSIFRQRVGEVIVGNIIGGWRNYRKVVGEILGKIVRENLGIHLFTSFSFNIIRL